MEKIKGLYMNIFITGGAGFIGSHLVEFHLSRGDKVLILDNLSTGSKKNIAPFLNHSNFNFEYNDIVSSKSLSKYLSWANRIYHMAAVVGMYEVLSHPLEALTTNILGFEKIIRTLSEVNPSARLIVASSSEIYGSDTHPLKESNILPFKSAAHSKWVYAATKFLDEIFSLVYVNVKKMKVTPIRFFNTIGPRQTGVYGMVVPRFIEQALSNQPITVYGSGEQVRSFCDVRDTVRLLDLISNNEETVGEIMNLGHDEPITMNQLAETIKEIGKSESDIIHVPYKKAYGQEGFEDVMYRRPDLKKLNDYTSYAFQWNLKKTLNDLIERKRNDLG